MNRLCKRALLGLFLMLFLSSVAFGATLKLTAEAVNHFNLGTYPTTFAAKITEDYFLDSGLKIEKDCIIEGQITKIVEPKRGNRDGYFYFTPTNYTVPSENNKIVTVKRYIGLEIKVKPYEPLDKKELVLDAGAGVASHFVKGISYPINFVRGVVEPTEGKGRLASGAEKVYEKSPLVYVEKGDNMELEPGDTIQLILKY